MLLYQLNYNMFNATNESSEQCIKIVYTVHCTVTRPSNTSLKGLDHNYFTLCIGIAPSGVARVSAARGGP